MAGVDIVDDAIIEPLTVLHRALDKPRAQLDAEGVRAFEERLLRLLTNRLRMKRDLRRHPEIADETISGPLIVMGMARSGTTKLQKVLAASGNFNFLPFWTAFNWASVTGEPNEPVEGRIAEAEAFCRWFDERSPEAKLGHSYAALEPEEEVVMTEASFVTPGFVASAEIPGYGAWLGQQGPTAEFEFLRDALKYLQWQGLATPDRPWLLKSPAYNSQEMDILAVFPDARFVMSHRTPMRTVPSMCKLVGHMRRAYGTSAPDAHVLVEHNAATLDRQLDLRSEHPDLPLLDVRFEDVVGDLASVVERIYRHAELPLGDDALAAMLRWDAENTMHKLGRFTYSFEEAGLDPDAVARRMRRYIEFVESR